MAIDTAAKRFSMMNAVALQVIHVLPTIIPDGTIAAADRQHLLDFYSGIAFASPAGVTYQGARFESIGGVQVSSEWQRQIRL